ncbi:aminoacylase-1-like [Ochlerotatus camptorhynchus]|uniref:aminoacylase-1-like n=1 Tax=Ochlerotatus camptorhynchus TaxID=644619 RepID=UPI0031DC8E07
MGSDQATKSEEWENNEDIKIFREYLKIPSVHPNINYDDCVEFLKRQAAVLDLPIQIVEVNPGKPIVIISWKGTNPAEKSIFLNSHMDVVPVYPEKWTIPPFSAHIDEQGRIYARGSQDMKCVGIQFLGVIRALKLEGRRLKRTLHVVFVPDEEIGGILGMKDFVKTDHFKALNCGFGIDEGYASENETFRLTYGERTMRPVHFFISGTAGHGSLLLNGTAGEKARYLIDKMIDFRQQEEQRLENNPELTLGDVTTINLTMMSGGVQSNVVPPELKLCFDIRVAHNIALDEFECLLEKWCEESGGGIRIEYGEKYPYIEPTKLDESNKYWTACKEAFLDMDLKVRLEIMPGATDIRYLRELNIPAIGFSPMNNTPVLLHDHDEYLQADVFLKGIEIYKNVISAVANV